MLKSVYNQFHKNKQSTLSNRSGETVELEVVLPSTQQTSKSATELELNSSRTKQLQFKQQKSTRKHFSQSEASDFDIEQTQTYPSDDPIDSQCHLTTSNTPNILITLDKCPINKSSFIQDLKKSDNTFKKIVNKKKNAKLRAKLNLPAIVDSSSQEDDSDVEQPPFKVSLKPSNKVNFNLILNILNILNILILNNRGVFLHLKRSYLEFFRISRML